MVDKLSMLLDTFLLINSIRDKQEKRKNVKIISRKG